jgi:hypothetical protein
MAKEKPSGLKAKLQKADPVIRKYIAELEKRNAKRQDEIVSLEADKVERDGKIEALRKEIKKGKPPVFKVEILPAAADPDASLVGLAGDLLKEIKPKGV